MNDHPVVPCRCGRRGHTPNGAATMSRWWCYNLSTSPVADIFASTPVAIGGQDLFWTDQGAFTGEISGSSCRLGCGYAGIGHAEGERIFGRPFHHRRQDRCSVPQPAHRFSAWAALRSNQPRRRNCRAQLPITLSEVQGAAAGPLVVATNTGRSAPRLQRPRTMWQRLCDDSRSPRLAARLR